MISVVDGWARAALALTIWREARGESNADARRGVAACIMNRVARPSWWGRTVDAVCFKKWQFSSLTDPHDVQLTTWPVATDPTFVEAWQIAGEAIDGAFADLVPGADSYYDVSLDAAGKPPAWIASARFCGQIDHIKFYDVDRDYERAA